MGRLYQLAQNQSQNIIIECTVKEKQLKGGKEYRRQGSISATKIYMKTIQNTGNKTI